jgi:hypothetical protein
MTFGTTNISGQEPWQRRGALDSQLSLILNPPTVRATRATDQAITHMVSTTVDLTAADDIDTDNMHSPSTDPDRITFNTAGTYLVGFHAMFESANDYDYVYGSVFLNATTTIVQGSVTAADASTTPRVNLSGIWRFAVGDYVNVFIDQRNTATAARNMLGGTAAFWAVRLGN